MFKGTAAMLEEHGYHKKLRKQLNAAKTSSQPVSQPPRLKGASRPSPSTDDKSAAPPSTDTRKVGLWQDEAHRFTEKDTKDIAEELRSRGCVENVSEAEIGFIGLKVIFTKDDVADLLKRFADRRRLALLAKIRQT